MKIIPECDHHDLDYLKFFLVWPDNSCNILCEFCRDDYIAKHNVYPAQEEEL